MVRRLLLILPLLLAGCSWTGDAFYAATDAQTAVTAGDYRIGDGPGPHDGDDRIHVAILPDGMTRFALPGRAESLAGFVPLGPDRHFFIMWVAKLDGQDAPAGQSIYGLIEALPGGRYRLYLPDCSGGDRAVAIAAGALVSPGAQPDCRFPDRAHLEAGFAAYARHPGEAMELVPVRPE